MKDIQPETFDDLDEITLLTNWSRRRPRPDGAPKHLSEDEIERLFAAIDDVRNLAIFRLAYHAGLRASEVGAELHRDYNARTERIFIRRAKGSNSGEHRLCRVESKAMHAWLKIRGSRPGPLFLSREHKPISRQMLHCWMRTYARLAELPEHLRHFHTLKHSCCVHLLSKGFNVEQVQDWVGHARIQSTMEYAKVTNTRRDEMAELLRDWR
jgi:type 1 fimbriae regulatory protein FimB